MSAAAARAILAVAGVALAGWAWQARTEGAPASAPAPAPAPAPATTSAPAPALQPLIDATPSGGTLRLPAGTWVGPATITRPMTLDGGGHAVLQGSGRGTVLSIEGSDVTLTGLRLRGSGGSHDGVDAGVMLQGRRHRVVDNRFDDVLFGIHLKGVADSLVQRNQVRGREGLGTGMRGDALRLWNSRGNRVLDNDFAQARDLTLINSPDNELRRNRFDDGRYGLHLVFSPRTRAEGNRITRTGTGIVVLYSAGVRLQGNVVAHALTDGGAGVVIKESGEAEVTDNELLHNAVGLKLDAPVQGQSPITVAGNLLAHNVVGLFFYGEAGSGRFERNRFRHNLTTVAVSAAGAGAGYRFAHNEWDDYLGFDRDGDQVGDWPHEVMLYSDRIWMETPKAAFFRNSPALELLDFLERLAPFSSPLRVLQDPTPEWPAGRPSRPSRTTPSARPLETAS